ncbi:chord-domain-containing protein [Agrocybe pediades]|nr:chord-domain-containing protein [Agrocybe pediades]
MPTCTRKGCGKQFQAGEGGLCSYHPGVPVFHEGLKSWSCCKDINKPVLDFDEFMQIEGCTEIEGHTTEAQAAPAASATTSSKITSVQTTADGKETFQVGSAKATPNLAAFAPPEKPVPAPAPILEVDNLNEKVTPGTPCRRKGCSTKFVSDEVNRYGDGEGTVCRYHPLPPIFREGSKGYLCCKRRVLEFDEFMKIEGCTTGRHCFIPVETESKADEQVECRIDHYQTPGQVHVSVFAKQVDKERSKVEILSNKINLDLFLPNKKRFTKSIELFGAVEPESSSFQVLGTKVELNLRKSDGRSWTVLEKTDRNLGNISLTFGVGGRTGTVGGKEIILDESNKSRA